MHFHIAYTNEDIIYASKTTSQVEDKNIHALPYTKFGMCIVNIFLWGRGMEDANKDPSR